MNSEIEILTNVLRGYEVALKKIRDKQVDDIPYHAIPDNQLQWHTNMDLIRQEIKILQDIESCCNEIKNISNQSGSPK